MFYSKAGEGGPIHVSWRPTAWPHTQLMYGGERLQEDKVELIPLERTLSDIPKFYNQEGSGRNNIHKDH